jgi:hypothetical protein
MSGFSADWLDLREPYDALARNPTILDAVVASLAGRPLVSIVDLAAGTGSLLRALAPRIPAPQSWRLVEHDRSLLSRAQAAPRLMPTTIAAVALDLSRDLDAALDGAVDLIATSAFLDLVSRDWLDRLAAKAAARSIPVYTALSYDGRIELDPSDPCDAAIVAAINAHQRRDKGFGPALGPTAARAMIAQFEGLDYWVIHGPADWVFGSNDRDIQMEVLAGWVGAAREIGDIALTEIAGWLARRRNAVIAGRLSMRVGHVDVFARPMGMR